MQMYACLPMLRTALGRARFLKELAADTHGGIIWRAGSMPHGASPGTPIAAEVLATASKGHRSGPKSAHGGRIADGGEEGAIRNHDAAPGSGHLPRAALRTPGLKNVPGGAARRSVHKLPDLILFLAEGC